MSIRSPCSHIDIERLRAFSKCFPANEVKSCPRNSSIDAAAVDPITDGAKSFLGAAGASQQNLRGTRSGGSVKWGGRRDRAAAELGPAGQPGLGGVNSALTVTRGRLDSECECYRWAVPGLTNNRLLRGVSLVCRERSSQRRWRRLQSRLQSPLPAASSHSHKPTVSPPPLARRFIHCKSHVWPFFGLVNLLMH